MSLDIQAIATRLQEAARNLEFLQQDSSGSDTASKAATAQPAAGLRISDDVLKQILASQIATNLNTGSLSNLAEKLDSSLIAKVKDSGAAFLENNFGQLGKNASANVIDGLRGLATGSANGRNPIPSQLSQLMIGRDAMLSDDPPPDAGKKSDADKKDTSKVSVTDGILAAMSEFLGDVGGFAFSVLTSNTSSPGDKANEFTGLSALLHSRENGSTHKQAKDYDLNDPASWDGTRTPLPDDVSNSTGPVIVTQETLRDLKARKNSASQPAGDDQSSGGGKINTGVNGTGRQASVSQPVPDSEVSTRKVVRAEDLQALEVRIQSRITTIR